MPSPASTSTPSPASSTSTQTFDSFPLHSIIQSNIKRLGFTTPTPIQGQAIPVALSGRDIIGLAQTGTGKTAAFGLPMIQHLLNVIQQPGARRYLRALVLAPTRELASQIHQVIVDLSHGTNLRSTTIYGGVGMGPQVATVRRGVDIVVACPGRLLDHVGQRTISLSGIEMLVLDECDQMLDMGFLPSIRQVIKQLPVKRQSMLFSATMPSDIRKLTTDILHNPATVQVDFAKPLHTVSHSIYPVPQEKKTALLIGLLKSVDTQSVLIFTRTKHRAKRLAEQLSGSGFKTASLQGNLSQNNRERAIAGFRNQAIQILVATDIAARGIDISSVSHVINYDMPDTVDAYTHRIGRTGRATRSGAAYTLVTREDGQMIRAIERALGCNLPVQQLAGFDLSAPVPSSRPLPREDHAPPHHRRFDRRRSGPAQRVARA